MSKDKELKITKKISSEIVFTCNWYNVEKNRVIFPNGKEGNYFVMNTKGSALIIPVTSDNKIILTEQYRYGSKKFSIELPCGGLKNNNHQEQAEKELEEETGYKANKVIKIGKFFPMNGTSSEICHVYLATKLYKTKQNLDDTESIKVILKTIKDVYKMVEDNIITDGPTIAALLLARKYLKI